ncbi:phosphatase PAP2 family protein [Tumebacillus sp. ITR2]|uniref:Phosphatase PAP2 family protein n=1 Tax=Tumebacillus amylolyticus TaxID=2801339 RepID=A0ABS1J8P6_9BACL|nr:phosphatase PAP2 family protein [Tumebacillus amylolyticus]MBL0386634.1 phosphatase PAP2 family protein [Tumebacillus amylolyticus]
MDKIILQKIRSVVGRRRSVDRMMVHMASKGPLWLFLVMGLVVVYSGTSGAWLVLQAVAAAVLTRGINEGIGRLKHRDRPFVQESFQPLLEHEPSFSFPSNHSACGFALAVAVFLGAPIWGAGMLVLAALMAYARLYVGVHYPFDVTAGALIGSAVAWLLHIVWV